MPTKLRRAREAHRMRRLLRHTGSELNPSVNGTTIGSFQTESYTHSDSTEAQNLLTFQNEQSYPLRRTCLSTIIRRSCCRSISFTASCNSNIYEAEVTENDITSGVHPPSMDPSITPFPNSPLR
jgi:hypothetical protein